MEEKKASTLFEEMKDDVSSYVRNTVELVKLEAYEKIAKGTAVTAHSLVMFCITLFALLFIFVTIGLYLGQLLQNMWLGFGIVSVFNIIVLLVFIFAGKSIKNTITNAVVTFLMDNDDDEKK